jgi:agmatinase
MDSLQGHGAAGHFGGLYGSHAELLSSEVVILPVPFDQTTTYRRGADRGPAALIEASRNMELYDIETDSEVWRRGIFTAPAIEARDSLEMHRSLYLASKRFLEMGKFVVVVGGEHSISTAPIRAHAEWLGPISVLQLDAHADLADVYEGDPFSHASVMARVREIPDVERIVAVGIRSMSREESGAVERANTFFAHEIDDKDLWMDRLVERLGERVYITFDLDAFDSSLMPSTGTPEPGGLFWGQAVRLLSKVAEERQVVGFDIVELLPTDGFPACDYLSAKLLYKLLSYIFRKKR